MDFKEWYSKPKNKKRMRDTMNKYYLKNKEDLKLYQSEKRFKQRYNQPKKNVVRNKIINLLKDNQIYSILTLESPDFLFSKEIPEQKIIVFENDKKNYELMLKKKPKNVHLFYGDVSEFSNLNSKVDMVYLDFCSNWSGGKEKIFNLREVIKNSRIFGLTLTIRDNKILWNGDYQVDLIKRIQELIDLKLQVLFGESYKDTAGMITLFFKVGEKNEKFSF